MPNLIPVLPRADSYLEIKALVNQLADEFERAYLVDGRGTTVANSVTGRGRSIDLDPVATAAGSTTGEPEGADPYVMRSKKYGSTAPSDDTAPLALDQANPDEWKRSDPPRKTAVAITEIGDGGLGTQPFPTNIEVLAGHGIPATGGPFFVWIVSSGTTPSIDGLHAATYYNSTNFTVAVQLADSGNSVGVGTMAISTAGVTVNEEARIYISGSGSGTFSQKIFTRQKKWDIRGGLYYVSGETLAEFDTESGSGSAGGGLP
jgi:hypothetical protein